MALAEVRGPTSAVGRPPYSNRHSPPLENAPAGPLPCVHLQVCARVEVGQWWHWGLARLGPKMPEMVRVTCTTDVAFAPLLSGPCAVHVGIRKMAD